MLRIDRALVILSLLAGSAHAEAPPSEPIVLDITANGTGCFAGGGSMAVTMAPDNTAFTVTYDPFLAQVGVGARSVDFRKTCQLSVFVHAPPGFTYAVAAADYAGFASLAAGATAVARTSYSFQGQVPTTTITHPFSGPFLDFWQFRDVIDVASLLFAPCGAQRNVNILTDLRVNVGTSDPATTTSFFELDPPVTYHLVWKRCP
jgi:hypothetical protein